MTRTCKSCREPFATAESIRRHRRDYTCRSADVLAGLGWVRTPSGWQHPPTHDSAYARRKR